MWVIFQTDPLPRLDSENKKETMFLICSRPRETGDVEDIRGRSGGFGVDLAVCRDDRRLGAIDPAAVRSGGRERRGALGEKPDGGRESRVPHGLRAVEASPLPSESGWAAIFRRPDDRSPPDDGSP
jgi:hypothetical protein